MGRFPPVVKTAVPVDGRFEHIVLSCNATSDHAIVWIEREARRAIEVTFVPPFMCFLSAYLISTLDMLLIIQLMREKDQMMEIPVKQRMERQETIQKEHTEEYKAALRRAVTLSVPHAISPSQYGSFDEQHEEGEFSQRSGTSSHKSWGVLIERLFDRDESGHMTLKKTNER